MASGEFPVRPVALTGDAAAGDTVGAYTPATANRPKRHRIALWKRRSFPACPSPTVFEAERTVARRSPQWILDRELGEQREIAVAREELLGSVRDAQCGDTGVVNDAAANARAVHKLAQYHGKAFRFGE